MNETPSKTDKETKAVATALRVFTILLTATSLVLVATLLGIQVFAIPRLIDVFQDFDTEIPTLTIWVIETPMWAGLIVGFFLIVLLVGKELVIRSAAIRLVIDFLAMAVLVVATLVVILALFLPMVRLMQSI